MMYWTLKVTNSEIPNGNGTLEPAEDSDYLQEERAADLVSRMTLDEKAGIVLY